MSFKVLIVDDEEVMCMLLDDVLTAEGYQVATADNGESALELIKANDYDIVLTDIKMPKMSGIELLHQISKISPDTIVIIMTGHATLVTARQAIKEGAYDYLMKPFDIEEARESIKRALDRKKLYLENQRLKTIFPLFEATNSIMNTKAHETLLKLILRTAISQTSSDGGAIMLFPPEGGDELMFLQTESLQLKMPKEKIRRPFIEAIFNTSPASLKTRNPGHPLSSRLSIMKENDLVEDKYSDVIFFPVFLRDKGVVGCIVLGKGGKKSDFFTDGDYDILGILSNQAGISIENAKLIEDLESVSVNTFQSLVRILEAKSPYTSGHSLRVSSYAKFIACGLGLSPDEIDRLETGGMLHDIGKIGISEDILLKPAALTDEEYLEVKRHPLIGDEMLAPLTYLNDVRPIIRHHHERIDGKGYPDGVLASTLSIEERVIVVADAFDAMLSVRPFRKSLTEKDAIAELEKGAGCQFDEDIVRKVIELINEGIITKIE